MEELEKLLKKIIESIAIVPDVIKIDVTNGGSAIVYKINVDEKDIGSIIGKNGRTIQSIRNIIGAVASKHKVRTYLQVVDEKGGIL